MTTPKTIIDWDAVEIHYRAGIRSLKDIGSEYGVSDAGILKRAKRDGWTRDLKAKIKAKADAKVSAAAVSAEVSEQKAANELTVIEANAEVQYRIRMEHRQDIGRSRGLFQALLGELEDATNPDGQRLLAQLMALLAKPEDGADEEEIKDAAKRHARMRALFEKTLDMSGRIDSAKKMTEMLERLIKMEREAFGIDDTDKGDADIEAVLKKLGSAE